MVLHSAWGGDVLGESRRAAPCKGTTSTQEPEHDNEVPSLGRGNAEQRGRANLVG